MNTSALTRAAAATLATALLAGCATPQHPDPRDPLEGFNRGVYQFNQVVAHLVIRPVAVAYDAVLPDPVQSCVHNIFSNLGDIWAGINSMLQGRGIDAINTWGRFLLNSTMGLGGCLDIGSQTGANKIPNDLGTTLGVWGFGQGPYIELPILGASTLRDSVGLVGYWFGDPLSIQDISNVGLRNTLWGVNFVDTRASLLDVTDTIDRTALDPYSFVRDAYLQRRAAMVRGQKGGESALPNYNDEDDTAAPSKAPEQAPAAPTPGTPAKQ
jgi:phospholipid-binding lipoprotein MlaA